MSDSVWLRARLARQLRHHDWLGLGFLALCGAGIGAVLAGWVA